MAFLPRPSSAQTTRTRSRSPPELSFEQTPSRQAPSKNPQTNGFLSPGRNGSGSRLTTDFNLNCSQRSQPRSHIFRDDRSNRGLLNPSEPDYSSGSPTNSALSGSANSLYTPEKSLADPPYNVFSRGRKRWMAYIVSLAALFSPLSANIYFPALGAISQDLGVTVSAVSLMVTVYMVAQGLAPSFWGPLSDTKGRRITFIRQ